MVGVAAVALFTVWISLLRDATCALFKGSDISCGVLLAQLTGACGSVRFSREKYCCSALRAWNDAGCWCERNAFNAASNVAMDYFAFQFRTSRCNLTSVFHEEIKLPNSAKTVLSSTCPKLDSTRRNRAVAEACGAHRSNSELRRERLSALRRLQSIDIVDKADLTHWSDDVDSLFSPQCWLASVGLSFSYPRTNVKKYLLYRSSLLGGPLWKSGMYEDTVLWTGSNRVSYASALKVGDFSFGRMEFVQFEGCSARISSVVVQEEEAVQHLKQYVYFEASERSLWKTMYTAPLWCRKVMDVCKNESFPYNSYGDCVEFAQMLDRRRQVTCAHDGELRSVVALHGNTVACRDMYVELARVDSTYCRLVGRKGIGRCRDSSCLHRRYNNIFNEKNPRFDSTSGYVCREKACEERWPVEASRNG